MTLKAFRKPANVSSDVEVLARATDDYTQQITSKPILDGFLLKDLIVGTTAKPFPHSLGRAWIGFFVTKNNVFVNLKYTKSVYDDKMITLTADVPATVDVWVF